MTVTAFRSFDIQHFFQKRMIKFNAKKHKIVIQTKIQYFFENDIEYKYNEYIIFSEFINA